MPKRRQDSEDDSEGETLLDTDDEEDSYDSDDDTAGSLEDFIAGEDEPLVEAPKVKTKKGISTL